MQKKASSQKALLAAMKEQDNDATYDTDTLADEYGVSPSYIRQARYIVGASRGFAEFFEKNRFSIHGAARFIAQAEELCRLANRRRHSDDEMTLDDMFSYHRQV